MYKVIFFSVIVFFFCSCSQYELEYSCDPVLNEIIKNHIQEYSQYTVNDVTKTTIQVQRAVFRSFIPEKKREIWLEKIQYLLTHETYTVQEYAHVMKIKNFLQDGFFEKVNLELGAVQRTQFEKEWISEAINNLGWTKKYIAFVIYRLYTSPVELDEELNTQLGLTASVTGEGECNCNQYSNYCFNSVCIGNTCEIVGGCGIFWSESCDGVC